MEAKILIVDDENAIQNLLTRYLAVDGYTCSCAGSVVSAKELLAAENFDLLLCDLSMPGESGFDLIQYAQKHYPHIGSIVITGSDSHEVASDIIKVGVYGYIIKPVTENIVLITVENALRHLRLDLHMNAYKIELEKKISRRTEKLIAIMNSLNVGMVMLDPDMKILEVNRKMQQDFPEVSSNGVMPPYKTMNSSQKEEVSGQCPIASTFQSGLTCESVERMTTAVGERDFRIISSPIFDKDGNLYAGIVLCEDITERLVLERDLRQAQKLESVGQLAAGIAHEINTPIQYIGDNLRFLKDSFEDMFNVVHAYEYFVKQTGEAVTGHADKNRQLSDAVKCADLDYLKGEIPKTIEQSLEGVHRVDKIVRAMKEFSHPGGDEKMAMEINKIIDSTVTVCRNEWKYVAELSTDFAPNLPLVPCFAGEISQALLNIIVNSAHAISDFTEGGAEGMGEIFIRTNLLENNQVQIRISDSGGGIPEKIRQKIFDPFFTTKARGFGTGQGLAIAHRVVVEKHQGAIYFETEMGRGTTFIINLPY